MKSMARLLGSLAVLAALVCIGGVDAAAQPAMQATEHQVKAAFVFKFGGYVEWPATAFEGPRSPLVIGVLGASNVADELTRIAKGHTVDGRPVLVRKLRRDQSLAGLHVIYIGLDSGDSMGEVLAASRRLPALMVTDSPSGIQLGSMINFVLVGDKLRFDVALAPAEARGLKISSRLLAVARTVQSATP